MRTKERTWTAKCAPFLALSTFYLFLLRQAPTGFPLPPRPRSQVKWVRSRGLFRSHGRKGRFFFFIFFRKKEVTVMSSLTLDQAAQQLMDCYAGWFDIVPCPDQAPLVARMDFHAHSSQYVLSKKAVLWEAESHEFVYLFQVPHLTLETYRACEDLVYQEGMARIQPGPGHMYTYLTALFLCQTCDDQARKALKACRRHRSFRLAYWGWMDMHTGLAELERERVTANFSGRKSAKNLAHALFRPAARSGLRP